MRRRLTSMAAVATVAAIVATGCGGGSGSKSTASQDPKAAFSTGLSGLSETDVLTITLKLDTTGDKLVGFAKESGDTLDPNVAQQIATADVVFETKSADGTKFSAVKPGTSVKTAARIAIQDGGQTLAELRVLSDALYAQADVKTLLDLFQQKKTAYADLTARAAQMPAFAQALVQGKWVSLDLHALKALAGQFGGANASPNAQQTQKLLADLKSVLSKDVTVARVGADDQGDHLRLTSQSRTFVSDFMQAVTADIPAASLATGSFKPSTVPDHSVVVDAWVKDGSLTKLSVDVVQFAKPSDVKPGDSLPVVLTFDRTGDDISKPAGATSIDTTQLFTLLGSLGSK
jgi:hypothetical protein